MSNLTTITGRVYLRNSYAPEQGKQYTTTYFQIDYCKPGKDGQWQTWAQSCVVFAPWKLKDGDIATVVGELGQRKDKEGNSRSELRVLSIKADAIPPVRQPKTQNAQGGAPQNGGQQRGQGQQRQQTQNNSGQQSFNGYDNNGYDGGYGDYDQTPF